MADMFSPDEIEKTRQLLELFGNNKLSELSVSEIDGFTVEIVAGAQQSTASSQVLAATVVRHNESSSPVQSAKDSNAPGKSSLKTLNSPMVGIFYAAGAPGDPPFVNVGDVIAVGQTIGLIEAMKVFSEIPAEASGRVLEIVAVTGTLVQQSEPLFRIEPV